MTNSQIEKLKKVFSDLSEEQAQLDLLTIPFSDKLKAFIQPKEVISVDVGDTIKNTSLMLGYSGIHNVLRVTKNEIVLKPNLIAQILKQ